MIGGWGFLLGDQGSGARMGRALCEAALLAHDGLTPALAAARRGGGGGGRAGGLVAFGADAPGPADFARYRAAARRGGGRGRRGAPRRSCARPRRRWRAAIDRLLADGPLPVCFLGGLGPVFAARLAGRYGGLIRAAAGHGARRRAGAGAGAGVSATLFASRGLRRRRRRAALPAAQAGASSAAIETGALTPGESLPPERELAGADRPQPGDGAQGGAGAGAVGPAGAAPRLGHLRRAAGRAGRAGAVAADLVLRGHGAARQGGALGLAGAGGARALARGDDGAGPDRARPGGAARAGAAGRRGAAGHRARRARRPRSCPTRRRSTPRSTRCWRERGLRPVRAVQRISAANLGARDAELLEVPVGAAGLRIERVSYLADRARRRVHPLALSRRRLRFRGRAARSRPNRKEGRT